ncbi:MAG: binding-protein-dependent transport system inner rane component [Frankiales bacterium]|nr:binding-protein-dependent transport system inner rane component [Frankiales bacterium]
MLKKTLRFRSAQISVAILLAVLLLAIFGSALAPQDPLHQSVKDFLQGPSSRHWLGTDYLGRDVLSRLLAGTRTSVTTAAEATLVGLVFGAIPGLLSAFLGTWFDFIANRITDAIMTLPTIVFAIGCTAVLGNSLTPAMLAIGFLSSPLFFRVTRAAALEFVRAQYVESAELFGASRFRIVRVHVLNKVIPTIAVAAAMSASAALLIVSSLTFLGIGVVPPAPTWGGVLASDLSYLNQAPWAPIVPAVLIMLTAGALNALADAIRDASGVHVSLLSAASSKAATEEAAATELTQPGDDADPAFLGANSANPVIDKIDEEAADVNRHSAA